jgi:hypothetical protein
MKCDYDPWSSSRFALVLPANVRLGCISFLVTNTLAYNWKKFYIIRPWCKKIAKHGMNDIEKKDFLSKL